MSIPVHIPLPQSADRSEGKFPEVELLDQKEDALSVLTTIAKFSSKELALPLAASEGPPCPWLPGPLAGPGVSSWPFHMERLLSAWAPVSPSDPLSPDGCSALQMAGESKGPLEGTSP